MKEEPCWKWSAAMQNPGHCFSSMMYFVIKDHPFSDGNKRISSFLFLVFLRENNLLEQSGINENGLVALALLIGESDPNQKDLMVRLILSLLARQSEE
jgi:DNA ligase (NAD+)